MQSLHCNFQRGAICKHCLAGDCVNFCLQGIIRGFFSTDYPLRHPLLFVKKSQIVGKSKRGSIWNKSDFHTKKVWSQFQIQAACVSFSFKIFGDSWRSPRSSARTILANAWIGWTLCFFNITVNIYGAHNPTRCQLKGSSLNNDRQLCKPAEKCFL